MRNALLASLIALALAAGCTRTAPPDGVDAPRPAAAPAAPMPTTPSPDAATDASATAAPMSSTVHLALSGDGLDLVTDDGRARHLLFDAPAAQAIDAVSHAYGSAPQRGRNEECGAGPLDMATWPGGLTLVMQDDRFVGWGASARTAAPGTGRLATMAGVGPGSTRRELESAYAVKIEETTLGQEFAAGGLFGVLDGDAPTARIDAMWAGVSCNFR
ncbi:hypothetical protein [Cognatilysobacter segetis]|uniref:hypothetical protein n=1 Tax=Cognatilysobacter segetis TaxID=2492394 RepID=UPI00106070A7|nr:hypothetical protein [Lysobacter segetis]